MAERPGMTRSTASQNVKLRRTEALRWSQRALRILSPSESLLRPYMVYVQIYIYIYILYAYMYMKPPGKYKLIPERSKGFL